MEANRKADILRLDKQFDFMTNESAKNDKREAIEKNGRRKDYWKR